MKIDTIITDMDDTLFDEAGGISSYTMEVMRRCLARGIRVIPCSGRAQASMEPFVRQLQTGLPYIACNGAQLVNADHTVMEESLLSAELARELCDFFEQNGCYVQVYRGDRFYYADECAPSRSYKKSSGMCGVAVGDLQAFLDFSTPKVLSVHEPVQIEKLYREGMERFDGRASLTISKPYFLEAAPVEATKGAALSRLAEKIGICPETTAVFGDSLNDISMLSFSPHSIAMGNARDEVKKAARYTCRPNGEDGMARFVQERILAE